MLAILSIDICASYLPWYTFVPIISQSMAVFGASAADLNVLCILYSLVYVPGVFLAGTLLNELGCRRCFVLATMCLTAGCALRCGPAALCRLVLADAYAVTADGSHTEAPAPILVPFAWLVLGQGLCACGQIFLVNATSHLAAEWFQPVERPAASMISNSMNFVGGCLSFMVPTWYVSPDAPMETAYEQVENLLVAQLKVSVAVLVLTVVLYRDVPDAKTRMGARAATPLFSELANLFALRDFWLINIQFGLYLTVLNTFDAVEGSLLVSYGYDEALSSWTAVSFCATSILSTAVESRFMHPQHYRVAIFIISNLLSATCVLSLVCLRGKMPPGCFIVAMGLMGFSTPGWGCSLEMGSEVCYPAREATVSSLLEAFGSIASIGTIMAAQWLIDRGCPALVLTAMAAGSVAGGCASLAMNGRLRRHEAEHREGVEEGQEEVSSSLPGPSLPPVPSSDQRPQASPGMAAALLYRMRMRRSRKARAFAETNPPLYV